MSESAGRVLRVSGLATLLALGCGTRSVQLKRLLQDGQEDQARAAAEYEHGRVTTTGTVAAAGLAKVEQYSATSTGDTSTLHRALEGYVYVVLASNDSQGRLVCFFGRNEMDTFGKFREGTQVTVEGRFVEYAEDQGVMIAVLTDCKEK
jgi:hypothetical protein